MCKGRKEKRAQREEDNKYKTARVEKREHPIMDAGERGQSSKRERNR